MAILPALPGINVSILTNDSEEPLVEYPDVEDGMADVPPHVQHKTTTNYIQSTPGACFSFRLSVGPPYLHDCDMLAFYPIINGIVEGDALLCGKDDIDEDGKWDYDLLGLEESTADGGLVLRKYRFTELTTTEGNPNSIPEGELELMESVGMIEIRVYRQRFSKPTKPKREKFGKTIKEVPEKIMKGRAISNTVELGEAEESKVKLTYLKTSRIDGDQHPVAVFRFKYRCRADLQALHIIPRDPTPPPAAFEELEETHIMLLAQAGHGQRELKRMDLHARRGTFIAKAFEDLNYDERIELARREYASRNGQELIKIEAEDVEQVPREPAIGEKRCWQVMIGVDGQEIIEVLDDDEGDGKVRAGPSDTVPGRSEGGRVIRRHTGSKR